MRVETRGNGTQSRSPVEATKALPLASCCCCGCCCSSVKHKRRSSAFYQKKVESKVCNRLFFSPQPTRTPKPLKILVPVVHYQNQGDFKLGFSNQHRKIRNLSEFLSNFFLSLFALLDYQAINQSAVGDAWTLGQWRKLLVIQNGPKHDSWRLDKAIIMFFAFLVHFRMACCRCLNDDCFRLPGEPQPFCTINISKSKSFISNIFAKLRKKKQHQTNIQFANLCAKWPEIELELAKKRDR